MRLTLLRSRLTLLLSRLILLLMRLTSLLSGRWQTRWYLPWHIAVLCVLCVMGGLVTCANWSSLTRATHLQVTLLSRPRARTLSLSLPISLPLSLHLHLAVPEYSERALSRGGAGLGP